MNFLFESKVKRLLKTHEINYWDKVVHNHPSLVQINTKKLSDYFNRKLYFNLVAPLAACYVLLFACFFTFKNSISNMTIDTGISNTMVKANTSDDLSDFVAVKEYVSETKDISEDTKNGEMNLTQLVSLREALYEE